MLLLEMFYTYKEISGSIISLQWFEFVDLPSSTVFGLTLQKLEVFISSKTVIA